MTKNDIEKSTKSKKSTMRGFYFPTLGITIEAKDEAEASKKAEELQSKKDEVGDGII